MGCDVVYTCDLDQSEAPLMTDYDRRDEKPIERYQMYFPRFNQLLHSVANFVSEVSEKGLQDCKGRRESRTNRENIL